MSPVTRFVALVLMVLAGAALTGCDRYVEQASLRPDGTIAFLAEADVICSNDLQTAVFEGDPCERIDAAAAGEEGINPFDVDLSGDFEIESSGERDRRRVLVRWQGPNDDFRSLLVSGATVVELAGDETQATFTTDGAPFDRLQESLNPAIVAARPTARWATGEFRAIAPAVVVDHNGDRVDGRSVIWVFDDDVPDVLTMTWSTEEPGFQIWWWIVGAVILGVVLIMIVTVEGRRGAESGGRSADAG